MRREARKRTWRSENFFSSSRVRLSVTSADVGDKISVADAVGDKPLLDLVEGAKESYGDEDDDRLLAMANLKLEQRKSAFFVDSPIRRGTIALVCCD